jgi:hypothetical protein
MLATGEGRRAMSARESAAAIGKAEILPFTVKPVVANAIEFL